MFFLQKRRKEDNKETTVANKENNQEETTATTQHLRVTKDINELHLPETCSVELGPGNDPFKFKLIVCPDEGYYKHARLIFNFDLGQNYPLNPPNVICETNIYHPNIDLNGNICLNILREEWNSDITLCGVVYGLLNLLLEPNAEDPFNTAAADDFKTDSNLFRRNVFRAIRGGYVGTVFYKGHSNNPMYTYRLEKTKKNLTAPKSSYMSAQKRITKDWHDLIVPDCCTIEQGPTMDFMKFHVIISPEEGYYEIGTFSFLFEIGENYPYIPPTVKCETMIFHPNIDIFGTVCLKILNDSWQPEFSLSSVLYSLLLLLLEPCPENPVNQDAADILEKGSRPFLTTVVKTIMGDDVGSVYYEPCLNIDKYDKMLQDEEELEGID